MTIVYMFTKTIVQGYFSVSNGDARSQVHVLKPLQTDNSVVLIEKLN